uniref:Uncharacterized protein n=1 Tax=Timema genevievae TaxID=629358 RepID=A0A7R9K9B7_TIMGE|nr:unnamed protein product [Timema genevievae]
MAREDTSGEKRKAAVRTTACVLDPPLGNTRLQVARLLSVLVATNNAEINKELINLGTVDVLLDLFFKYSWNNFLHCQVEQFLAFALNAEVRPGTGDVFPDSHLLQHIGLCEYLYSELRAELVA